MINDRLEIYTINLRRPRSPSTKITRYVPGDVHEHSVMIFGNRTSRFRQYRVSSSRFTSRAGNFFSPASWKQGGLTRHRFGGASESNLPRSLFLSLSLPLFSHLFSLYRTALLLRPGRAAATCRLSTIPGVGFSDFHGGSRGAIPSLSLGAR
jgi:hypothetical protein